MSDSGRYSDCSAVVGRPPRFGVRDGRQLGHEPEGDLRGRSRHVAGDHPTRERRIPAGPPALR